MILAKMKIDCAVYHVANIVGKRWVILILVELFKGECEWKRYSELKKKLLNITPKILSMRLKELVSEGLIEKKVEAETLPIQSKYHLTKDGKELMKIVKFMKKWSLQCGRGDKACNGRECKRCSF